MSNQTLRPMLSPVAVASVLWCGVVWCGVVRHDVLQAVM